MQEFQRTLKQMESGLEVASESLRALCRAYPAQQLARLGEDITNLVKRCEAAAQRSTHTLGTLQETLLRHFNGEGFL